MTDLFETPVQKKYVHLAPFFLRLIIGYGFMAHGFAKLSRGPAGFEKLLTQLGVPLPHLSSWLVPLTEFFGGLAILLGIFVNIAALPLIVTMLVAMLTVHLKYGFSSVNTIGLTPAGPRFGPPGFEIDLLYIAGLISLVLTGPGAVSLHQLFKKSKPSQAQK